MISHRVARFFLLAGFASVSMWAAANDPTTSVKKLGVRIKQAADLSDAGKPPTSAELSRLSRDLAVLKSTIDKTSPPALTGKYRSIAALLGRVTSDVARHRQPMQSSTSPAANDIEKVTASHGSRCDNALGVSELHPVTLLMPSSADVWLHLESRNARNVRVATNTQGLDPALEVFPDCRLSSKALARSDDAIGLDAIATFSAPIGTTYVHVANTGGSGKLTISLEDLASTGSITGVVTDSVTGDPIAYQSVYAVCTDLSGCGNYATTDQTGRYTLTVQPGTVYVKVNADQYIAQLYPNAFCLSQQSGSQIDSCDVAHATQISVSAGATVANIDLALSAGHSISGVVRDSSNVPISSINSTVFLQDVSGTTLNIGYADMAGHYSFDALPDATYKVQAAGAGYGSQLYKNVACTGAHLDICDPALGTPIVVAGANAIGIDFHLPVLAAFQGHLSATDGTPLPYAEIDVYDTNGVLQAQGRSDQFGNYRTASVTPGSYYVSAGAGNYFSQLYAGYDCPGVCSQSLSHGTVLTVANATQQVSADFHLTALPTVTGHVQDAATGLPLSGVVIEAGTTPPVSLLALAQATTDSAGNFSFDSLGGGTYYLWARSVDHVDQIYSGLSCEQPAWSTSLYFPCTLSGATLLTIAPGVTPIVPVFSLQASATIHGHVSTQTGTAYDLPASSDIAVYDTSGTAFRYASTDMLGNYVVTDLPPGTYFVEAGSGAGTQFVTQLWQGISCATSCLPTTGTPIVVSNGQEIDDIDFSLARTDAIVGRVTDQAGNPIIGTIIDLFRAADGSYERSVVVDSQGFYVGTPAPDASYLVATEAGGMYVDQVYAGIECPLGAAYYGLCPLTSATPIALNSVAATPRIANFVLQIKNEIFGNGFD